MCLYELHYRYYLTEVRRVLDSVVAALAGDESLRFAWAESAYLWRWWQVRLID